MEAPEIVLRPYQDRAVQEVREHFRTKKAVLFQLATGGGKTLTAGSMLGSAARKGNPSLFIVNRIELVDQTAKAFDSLQIPYGIIAPGFSPKLYAPVQIASIDTLKNRLKHMPKFIASLKLAVWDECRGVGAAGWTEVFRFLAECGVRQLGLDATPIRLDGRGLDEYFEAMVCGPTYSELVDLKCLVPFDSYAPSQPDLSQVKTARGEFDQAGAEAVMDVPTLVGDVVEHYLKHARGKRGLTFACSVKHSENLAAAYRTAGVRAMHLDGGTDKTERKRIVAAYRRGELEVLTNVDLFTAGFDVPGVEVISMARPTKSLSMFLQQCGRASRPAPGKTHGILLDHAGNIMQQRHGLPDMDREWTLAGRPKGKKKKPDDEAVKTKRCEACFRVFWPPPTCPYCGHEHEVQSREIAEREGELRKVTKEEMAAIAAAKAKDVKNAKTLPELLTLADKWGYSEAWAHTTFKQKNATKDKWAKHRAERQFEAYRR